MAKIGFFDQKISPFLNISANSGKTKKDINKMLCKLLDNTLRISYMKYEHISSNRYRVLAAIVFEYVLKMSNFGRFVTFQGQLNKN